MKCNNISKKDYRKLSLKIHPDKNNNSEDSQKAFDLVNKAYNVLTDEALKEEYDLSILNQNLIREEKKVLENQKLYSENYTMVDGNVYTGEINKRGQCDGFGTKLFHPNPEIDGSTSSSTFIPFTTLNDLVNSSKTEQDFLQQDSKNRRLISTNFKEDQIIDSNLKIEFLLKNQDQTIQDGNDNCYFYKGEYKLVGQNILRHGFGIMKWGSVACYEGYWKDDVFHHLPFAVEDLNASMSSDFPENDTHVVDPDTNFLLAECLYLYLNSGFLR